MRKKDLARLKSKLEEMRDQINHNLVGITNEVKTPDVEGGYSQHQADEGTDNFGKTIALGVTRKEYEILRQIERALEKMDEGTYGVCDITGEKIPLERLDAVPYAVTTVKAQEMVEKGLV